MNFRGRLYEDPEDEIEDDPEFDPQGGVAWVSLSFAAVLLATYLVPRALGTPEYLARKPFAWHPDAGPSAAMLIHFLYQPGLLYALTNAFGTVYYGRAVEGRYGHGGLAAIFLAGCVGSAAVSVRYGVHGPGPILGAQGGVVALAGATLVGFLSPSCVARLMPLLFLWPGTFLVTDDDGGDLVEALYTLRGWYIDAPHAYPQSAHGGGFAAGVLLGLALLFFKTAGPPRGRRRRGR